MATRVLMFATIKPDQEAEFEEAFATVRRRVAGTPGHRFDELLREEDKPGAYVLISEWESTEKFLEWQEASIHIEMTGPMHPYFAKRSDLRFYEIKG